MIFLLNDCYDVEIVNTLKNPDNPNELLDGLVDEENNTIKIAKYAHNKVSVLIHELCHIIFDDVLETIFKENAHENFILNLEKILFKMLSTKQKNILKSYLKQ